MFDLPNSPECLRRNAGRRRTMSGREADCWFGSAATNRGFVVNEVKTAAPGERSAALDSPGEMVVAILQLPPTSHEQRLTVPSHAVA